MKTFILGRTIEELKRLVPQKQIKTLKLNEQKICLTRNEETFFAFELLCPHRKADLSKGLINNEEVICPLHEYRFDLNTGQVRNAQCQDLRVYKTELTDQGLKIYF
jgi:nitrite reductase/ring-hydroxylating ferredoxin subunit